MIFGLLCPDQIANRVVTSALIAKSYVYRPDILAVDDCITVKENFL
jgi:hypothetical protein